MRECRWDATCVAGVCVSGYGACALKACRKCGVFCGRRAPRGYASKGLQVEEGVKPYGAACKETLENTIQYYTYTLNDKISDAAALWGVVHGGRATRSCVSKLHGINQDLLKLTASMQAEEGEEC